MTRVALYIRVSTQEQAQEGLSLGAQLETCLLHLKLLAAQDPERYAPPYCVYADAGISAKSVEGRPAMRQLMEDVAEGRIRYVVATKLDRLFRNVRDAAECIERIHAAGCDIAMLDLRVDTASPGGELVFNLMAAVAQFERKRTGERILDVLLRVAGEGRHIGPAPFGYARNPETRLLEPDPERADTVRLIFDLYTEEGYGLSRIAKELNERGVPYKTGRDGKPKRWERQVVQCILLNPAYAGIVLYNRVSGAPNKDRWKWKWWTQEDRSDWVKSQGLHEPLVPPEQYDRARDLQLRHKGGRAYSRRSPYAGLAFCGGCGAALYSRAGWVPYYECSRAVRFGKGECELRAMIQGGVLERIASGALCENLRAAGAAGFRVKPCPEKWSKGRTAKKKAETAKELREKVDEKIQRLTDLFADGEIKRPEYQRRKAAALAELAALGPPEGDGEGEPAIPPLDRIREVSDPSALLDSPDLTPDEKHDFVKDWIQAILVHGGTVEVRFQPYPLADWERVIEKKRHRAQRGPDGRFGSVECEGEA